MLLKFMLISVITLPITAFATIWITLADPKSNKIGAIGASSGFIGERNTVVHVDNRGIAVIGANYLGRNNQELYQLLTAPYNSVEELVNTFSESINRDPRVPRRVTLVTSKFETATAATWGCNAGNQYCAEHTGGHFAIAGGGLESEQVIAAAVQLLSRPQTRRLALECQLYLGMRAMFEAGGEILLFRRVAYLVDDLGQQGDGRISIFHRGRWQEEWLLEQLEQKLIKDGHKCW
jgi:hypothetical protein